jgi:hypothetical protein
MIRTWVQNFYKLSSQKQTHNTRNKEAQHSLKLENENNDLLEIGNEDNYDLSEKGEDLAKNLQLQFYTKALFFRS